MKYEQPNVGPNTETEQKDALDKDPKFTMGNEEDFERGRAGQSSEKFSEDFNSENRGIFSKMSEAGKEFAGKVYEKLYEKAETGTTKLVGRMGIAYNQMWMNFQESKASEQRDTLAGYNVQINALDQSTKEIEAHIIKLQEQGMPGAGSLEKELRNIERKKETLLGKSGNIQSKLEKSEGKASWFANERDRFATELISRYNEKLEPIEQDLELRKTRHDEAELEIAVIEAKHQKLNEELAAKEKQKAELIESLQKIGKSERQINKNVAITSLDKRIAGDRAQMRSEMAELTRKKNFIEAEMIKANAKANPYRKNRNELERIKGIRPSQEQGKVPPEEEVPRPENRTTKAETAAESSNKNPERATPSEYFEKWNEDLHHEFGDDIPEEFRIDPEDFAQVTRPLANSQIDAPTFKGIFGKFLRARKKPGLLERLKEFLTH